MSSILSKSNAVWENIIYYILHLILIIHYIMETGNKQRQKNKNQEMILLSYDDLLIESTKEGLIVREVPLTSADGRIDGKNIFIRQDIETTAEKACVLADRKSTRLNSSH